jgi:hypothetical protein
MSKSVVSAVILLGLLFGLGLLVGSRAAQKRQIIFEQPQLQGVSDNVHVPLAERRYPDDRPFNLIVWQPNSYRPDGELVPTVWRAGDMTGFYPPDPPARYQLAFRDLPGSSTVQIAGDTVGAYISSRDLPGGSPGEKMMITPAFKLPKTVILFPFLDRGTSIVNSLELQVPTAVDANRHGNFTYVSPTFFFRDRKSDTRISYGVTCSIMQLVTCRPRASSC